MPFWWKISNSRLRSHWQSKYTCTFGDTTTASLMSYGFITREISTWSPFSWEAVYAVVEAVTRIVGCCGKYQMVTNFFTGIF